MQSTVYAVYAGDNIIIQFTKENDAIAFVTLYSTDDMPLRRVTREPHALCFTSMWLPNEHFCTELLAWRCTAEGKL